MTEAQAVKRGPGRPPKQVLNAVIEGTKRIEAEAVEDHLPIDLEARPRIAVCNDIKFVLRGEFGRKDFDASFLKTDLTALPKSLVTPEFIGMVRTAQSLELVC